MLDDPAVALTILVLALFVAVSALLLPLLSLLLIALAVWVVVAALSHPLLAA